MATYTIPLRSKAIKVQRYRRAKKAVSAVKEFIVRHQKTAQVRIGTHLNNAIWKHGIRNFPKSVKVNAEKDDDGIVRVELFGVPKEKPKTEEKKEKAPEKPAEEPKADKAVPGSKLEEAKQETAQAAKPAEVEKKAQPESPAAADKKPQPESKQEKKEQTPEKPAEEPKSDKAVPGKLKEAGSKPADSESKAAKKDEAKKGN